MFYNLTDHNIVLDTAGKPYVIRPSEKRIPDVAKDAELENIGIGINVKAHLNRSFRQEFAKDDIVFVTPDQFGQHVFACTVYMASGFIANSYTKVYQMQSKSSGAATKAAEVSKSDASNDKYVSAAKMSVHFDFASVPKSAPKPESFTSSLKFLNTAQVGVKMKDYVLEAGTAYGLSATLKQELLRRVSVETDIETMTATASSDMSKLSKLVGSVLKEMGIDK